MTELREGIKYDEGKVPFDLLSPDALWATTEVLGYGAEKYREWNWAKGIKYSRIFSALMRHLWLWWRGEDADPETGYHHLAHASCCLMYLLHYELNHKQYQAYMDRPDLDNAALR
jgi:hypothetical protein